MRRLSVATLLDRPGNEGLLAPGAMAAAGFALRDEAGSPVWYEELIAAAGAWLAASLFLGFALAAGLEDGPLMVVTGLSLAAAATVVRWWVARLAAPGRHGVAGSFVVQLALAGSVLARLLVGAGLDREYSATVAMLGLLALEAALLVAYPDPVQQFVAIVAASVWLVILLHEGRHQSGYEVLLLSVAAACGGAFLYPAWLGRTPLWRAGRPIAYGLATAGGVAAASIAQMSTIPGETAAPGKIATWGLAMLLAVLAWLLRRPAPVPRAPGAGAVLALVALAVATQATPGIMLGVGIVVLGAGVRERSLLILGAVYVVAFAATHYYNLELDLLHKLYLGEYLE